MVLTGKKCLDVLSNYYVSCFTQIISQAHICEIKWYFIPGLINSYNADCDWLFLTQVTEYIDRKYGNK